MTTNNFIQKYKEMTKSFKLLCGFHLVVIMLMIIGCGGCGAVKKESIINNEKVPQKQEIAQKDTTKLNTKMLALDKKYLPPGGVWDSLMYYYLDSTEETRYKIWDQFNDKAKNPYVIYVKDPSDTFEVISVIIKNPKTGEQHRKINHMHEDNPYIKAGFKVLKRDDTYIYFETPDGVTTNKAKLRKYLPEYLYDEIPQILTEGAFVSVNLIQSLQNGFTVSKHSFEVEGIGREWIHGDYATWQFFVYDQKGKLVLDYFGDCEQVELTIDPTGRYALITKDYYAYKKYEGVPQKSCIEIIDLKTKKVVFNECEIDYKWQFNWTKFGYSTITSFEEESTFTSKLYILNPFISAILPINKNDRNKIITATFLKEKWIEVDENNETTEYNLINPNNTIKLK